mgnify:CR=1 FL=1
MKVVLVGLHFSLYCLTLTEALRSDHTVAAFLPRANFLAEVGEPSPEFDVTLFEASKLRKPAFVLASLSSFSRLLKSMDPDVVHFQESGSAQCLALWTLAARYPRVLTVHDATNHPGRDSRMHLSFGGVRERLRRSADGVIVHGQQIAKQMYTLDPTVSDRLHVVAHPAFRARHVAAGASGDGDALEILLLGRMEAYKGVAIALEACERLRRRGLRIRLTLAGKGPELAGAPAGAEEWLRIVGGGLGPAAFERSIASADALLLPYIEGSASGIIAFGLGMGKAMIASRVGAFGEYIEDGVSGLLIEPGSVARLCAAIERLYHDRALLRNLAATAGERGRGAFSPEETATQTTRIYALAANRRQMSRQS